MSATSGWDSNTGTLTIELLCYSNPKIILPGAKAVTFELSFQRTQSQRLGAWQSSSSSVDGEPRVMLQVSRGRLVFFNPL